MVDRPQSTHAFPDPSTRWHRFVAGEVIYIAAFLRATAARIELLADSLPLPDSVTANRVLEEANEEMYCAYPALSLHVDLETLAHDLSDVAGRLEETAETNLAVEEEGCNE